MIPVLSAGAIELPNQINADKGSFGEKSDRPNNPSTIVFIDAAVADYQTLLDGVKSGVEAIVIDSHRDGVEQISEVLANRTNIDSIHLVSHGEPGSLQLGKTRLSVDNLEAYSQQLQQWRRALTLDADILIYGCNVAAASPACQKVHQGIYSLSQSESRLKPTKNNFIKQSSKEDFCYETGVSTPGGLDEPALEDCCYETGVDTPDGLDEPALNGVQFLHRIASLTGANIAASKHLTGSAKLGGNWELEEKIGKIKSPLAFESNAMQNYASVLATYIVTNTNDSGTGSLRDAITQANFNPGLDTINFEIPGPGPHTITLLNYALPVITSPVIIDGKSQPGYAGKPIIELNGSLVQSGGQGSYIGTNGIELSKSFVGAQEDSSGSTIQGLVINGFGKNASFFGGFGIWVETNNNTIQDNYIGTDMSGSAAVSNTMGGIRINSDNKPFVPNPTTSPVTGTIISRNVISGNGALGGIFIAKIAVTNTTITGNYIGTDATGTIALGNEGDGILILDRNSNNNVVIGGTAPGEGNVIANNKGSGIEINAPGSHTIQGNSIFNNQRLGIDLIGNTGITPNDLGDADTGSNNLQNYPVLTSVSGNTVSGILNSTPNANFRVEFFANTSYDPAGAGQGETFIGFQDVTTDSAGNANINFAYTPVAGKPVLAATATNTTTGDTSEFSLRNQAPVNTVPGRTTTTTTNPNNITINSGDLVYNVLATPYPSEINVSDVTGNVDSVTATLNNVQTFNGWDGASQVINLLLVGPDGQNVVLMSHVGSAPLNNITLNFDDNAAAFLGQPYPTTLPIIDSGNYKPSNYSVIGFRDIYPFTGETPTGAPEGPYGSTLSVFNKTTPNGTWKLFAVDANQEFGRASGATNPGSIASWSLNITTDIGKETTTENTPRIFSASNGNSISVADSDSESVEVNLSVTSGTLTLNSLTGLTGSGNGSNSLIYTGKQADINAALEGLTYTPNPNFVGTDTLTLTTNDRGAPELGGAQTDSDRVDITVNPLPPTPTPPTPTPPTPTPTPTPAETPTPTPPTPTPTPTPPTPTPTPTPPTPTPTPTPPTPTPTPTPAETPTPTPPTPTPTPTPAETPTPTPPTPTPTPTPAETPTPTPPTPTPTPTPAETPTPTPPTPTPTPTPAETPTPTPPT
ncbi:DUF4347 domain-containing protein, partial [Microcoleus vaginatus]|uniref:DUF4347 domain-containing protein n=1 Tax=Microcoleus vaginatus TaxID=119532 RepID=UPI004040951B